MIHTQGKNQATETACESNQMSDLIEPRHQSSHYKYIQRTKGNLA